MRLLKLLPLFLLAAIAPLSCRNEIPTLNLLVWEGYADPSFVQEFEQRHHCKVTASYMGSSDELVAKLKGGGDKVFDVISPSSDVAGFLVHSGLVAPLDVSKFAAYARLSSRLTALPLVKQAGKVYGVPFMWGPDPLLYDTRLFSAPPESWSVFWDPQYRGKVSVWDDISTLYLAAQVLRFDKEDPSTLYNLTDEQLAQVKLKLLELKPNIRKYWSTGGELINLFSNGEIVLAVGWPLMTNQLRKLNFPIGETIPKETTTGWIDHLMITASSPNRELAEKFLEFMIEAQTQKKVTGVTGYTPANPEAAKFMSPDQATRLHLDKPDEYMSRINFWQHVARRNKYNEVWNEVKAAP